MGCHSLYVAGSDPQTSGVSIDDVTARRDRATRERNELAEPAPPAAPPARGPAPIPAPLLGEPPVVLDDPPAIFGGGSHTW